MKKVLFLSLCLVCFCSMNISARNAGSDLQGSRGVLGDSNNSGNIGVADVVTITNHILELPVNVWNEDNADVNNDGVVTVSDITSVVDIILHNPYNFHTEGNSITKIADRIIADNFHDNSGKACISFYLDNSMDYACLQAEVIVPEGMTVSEVKPGPRAKSHEVLYNITSRGTIKIVVVSLSNFSFVESNEPLFSIVGSVEENCGNIIVTNIIAANSDYNNYELGFAGGLNENISTSVNDLKGAKVCINPIADGIEIRNASGQNINVYTIGGEHIKTVVAISDYEKVRLPKGLYLITIGNQSAKVIV